MFNFVESFHEARVEAARIKVAIPRGTQSPAEQQRILDVSLWWDNWTGSRYEREMNPVENMTLYEYRKTPAGRGATEKPIIKEQLARSCPYTGDYEILPMHKEQK